MSNAMTDRDTVQTPLVDSFGRVHDYLRISLTERCNLRCTYCMPPEGVVLSPKERIMRGYEIVDIAGIFTELGIKKIRLTGGEPLVRKNLERILRGLAALPVTLSLTTNGVLLDRYLELLKELGIRHLNISLDHLHRERFYKTTLRDQFERVMRNIALVEADPFFRVKINVVLIKGVNDDEIVDFVRWTEDRDIDVRFIEFMPFAGNGWDGSRVVGYYQVLERVLEAFGRERLEVLDKEAHATATNFRIKGFRGRFGIIATVTKPFCGDCNRLRLTANGHIRNCLFAREEIDILTPYRQGLDIRPFIQMAVQAKHAQWGGWDKERFYTQSAQHNRSMILIGG